MYIFILMEYIEFIITRKVMERIIFLTIILILLGVAYYTANSECKVKTCNEEEKTQVNEDQKKETNNEQTTQETEIVQVQEESTIVVNESQETNQEETQKPLTYYVDIENMRIAPSELIIKKNSMIVFRNKEAATAHKLYEIKGLFFGPRMVPGDAFNYTFNVTGEYTIFSITGKAAGTKMDVKVI
jgi:plastocyanin